MSDKVLVGPLAEKASQRIYLVIAAYWKALENDPTRFRKLVALEVQHVLNEQRRPAGGASPEIVPSQFVRALCDLLTEIIGALNYQPDIPLEHKTDMLNALVAFKRKCGIELPPQPKERAT